MIARFISALICVLCLCTSATGQLDLGQANGIQLGNRLTQRWKCGMEITAPQSPCLGVFGTVTVPTDWPEQEVRIVKEDFSEHSPPLSVKYRTLENGVRQMLVGIPRLNPGERAHALVTFEVTKASVQAPDDTSQFVIPKRVSRDVAKFLAPSPKIESRHGKIRKQARELMKQHDDDLTDWEKVEEIYDWVRENVEYTNGPIKGALAALEDGDGDCEELTSLFIALCRANRIPARSVWVPGHCYPEFYLQDQDGEGHWFPCQAAGTRDFGSMPDQRPILQKGDNYRVPEQKKPQRYVAEFLKIRSLSGGGKPQFRFVRQLLEDTE